MVMANVPKLFPVQSGNETTCKVNVDSAKSGQSAEANGPAVLVLDGANMKKVREADVIELLFLHREMSGMLRRVLVLGSGFTAGPLVEYLTRDGTIAVTVGEPNFK